MGRYIDGQDRTQSVLFPDRSLAVPQQQQHDASEATSRFRLQSKTMRFPFWMQIQVNADRASVDA
jgi:hypothetical protein